MVKKKCKWEKIVGIEEPRFEVTKVKGKYEVYHEPSGAINKFSKTELLNAGLTEKQLKETEKETTYFKRIFIFLLNMLSIEGSSKAKYNLLSKKLKL